LKAVSSALPVHEQPSSLRRAESRFGFRDGISWRVGAANDAGLVESLGLQEIVVANRFLGHMSPAEAEACLRNLDRFVKGGGYLFVSDQPNEIRPWGLEDVSEKRKHVASRSERRGCVQGAEMY
jgi:hypothetical protein